MDVPTSTRAESRHRSGAGARRRLMGVEVPSTLLMYTNVFNVRCHHHWRENQGIVGGSVTSGRVGPADSEVFEMHVSECQALNR